MPLALPIVAQQVRWRPPDGPAGICFWSKRDRSDRQEMEWSLLKPELEARLLPQVLADPRGYSFAVFPCHGKPDWLVRIVDAAGEPYCGVWFGGNPDRGWVRDYLIHVGDTRAQAPDTPVVWQSYRRHSDGSYALIHARCATADELTRQLRP